MEFYNPISELEWTYGTWKGTLSNEEGERDTILTIKSIGSEIVEFNLLSIQDKYKNCHQQ